MSFGITRTCQFKLLPDREVEISPINLKFDQRGTIHGTVVCKDKPVKGALVKLFTSEKGDHDSDPGCDTAGGSCDCPKLKAVAHQFTDKCGQFLFGVPPGSYIVKATLTRPFKDIDFVDCVCDDDP